jgi:hypothetical protein
MQRLTIMTSSCLVSSHDLNLLAEISETRSDPIPITCNLPNIYQICVKVWQVLTFESLIGVVDQGAIALMWIAKELDCQFSPNLSQILPTEYLRNCA